MNVVIIKRYCRIDWKIEAKILLIINELYNHYELINELRSPI